MRRFHPVQIAGIGLLLASVSACTPPALDAPRGFAFRVPPGITYDLTLGKVLTPGEQGDRLRGVRLLMLGEHHEDPRSHAAQLEILKVLQARGRLITVALEMFPPSADDALEEWRLGRIEEAEFLERSRWYEHWGYAWRYYRDLFLWFREQQIPLRGVNADPAMRLAARKGDPSALPKEAQAEIGDLAGLLEPHRDLLLAQLQEAGHGGTLEPDAPQFKAFLRVQTLWDRVMGRRAVTLAESLPSNGIVVLLIGSGHVAYKLGANLQAAQVSSLQQLSVWDTMVGPTELDPQGRGYVPVGVSDWARLYLRDAALPRYPMLSGLKLTQAPAGVLMEARTPFAPVWVQGLMAGDLIRSVNGVLAGTPTRLRLTVEALSWGEPVEVLLDRQGKTITVALTPQP